MSELPDQSTELVRRLSAGERQAAELLMPIVYDDLRRLAAKYLRQERIGHTLQPTALVHEAFMRLVDQTRVNWRGQTHFGAVAAQAMRRILVDHARTKGRSKRGGGRSKIELSAELLLSRNSSEDVLVIDEALARLAELDPRQAKIVEMRFFAGMNVEEVAEALDVSKRTVEAEWTVAKAWLRRELSHEGT